MAAIVETNTIQVKQQTGPSHLLSLFQPAAVDYRTTGCNGDKSLTSRADYNIILTNDSAEEEEEEKEVIVQLIEGCCSECISSSNPLLEAVNFDHVECLKHILTHQQSLLFSPTAVIADSVSVHVAARKGSVNTLQTLIAHDPLLAHAKDYKGATPLHTSARHGQLACLSYLLHTINCSANVKDCDGATPVHFAAVSGSLSCLKELCINGNGDVNITTTSGETPGIYTCHIINTHTLIKTLMKH